MKLSIKKGFSFGLTSGTITTLGLIMGLESGTGSKLVILGGILTIAVADAFSDALGIHISEESENKHTTKEIWESTIATFLSKFIFALTFAVPFLFLSISSSIIICIIWGLFLLIISSYFLARQEKLSPIKVISEHVIIAVLVVLITHYLGQWIAIIFN
jgi:VIT1/CCC1 family predicted Fe2+/Mn2+ transporter